MNRDLSRMSDPEQNPAFLRGWTDSHIPDNPLAERCQELQAARLRQMRKRFAERQNPKHEE